MFGHHLSCLFNFFRYKILQLLTMELQFLCSFNQAAKVPNQPDVNAISRSKRCAAFSFQPAITEHTSSGAEQHWQNQAVGEPSHVRKTRACKREVKTERWELRKSGRDRGHIFRKTCEESGQADLLQFPQR